MKTTENPQPTKTIKQPQHTQGKLEAYPEAHLHTEKYPKQDANPYRVDIAIGGFAQNDGSGLVAKVYGKTDEEALANAQRIVKAVNEYDFLKKKEATHDELIKGLKSIMAGHNANFIPAKKLEMVYSKIEQLLFQSSTK